MKKKIPERTKASLNGLRQMINYLNKVDFTKDMTIVEIGSWTGCSSMLFAQFFKKVICVDPWSPTVGINTEYDMSVVEQIFDSRKIRYDNIEKYKMTSENAAKKIFGFRKDIDIVYIDGAHDYINVVKDIILWRDVANKYVTGHDYWHTRFPGVIRAVNEMFGKPDKTFPDTSWLVKK